MWNNLRARHYSVLILTAIVALQTLAIGIDRFVLQESEEAFVLESSFQNNSFIQSFRMADASCAVLPVRINELVSAHENKSSRSTQKATPANEIINEKAEDAKETQVSQVVESAKTSESSVSKSLSVDFVAAANTEDSFANFIEYAVQPGDNISNIAELFGTKTEDIKKANQLEGKSLIKAGQTLKVPTTANQMCYTVKKGDSLSRLASRFNISMETLIQENNLKSHVLRADQKIVIPVSNRGNIQMVKAEPKKIDMVKSSELPKVADPTKLQMVKSQKLPIAVAPAAAKKSEISFDETDVLKTPAPVVAAPKVKEAEKESVEIKVNNQKVASLPKVEEKRVIAISADDVATDEEPVGMVYKVSKGDSLLKIANKFNTTVAQIQSDNDLKGDMVKLGQSLKINPGKKRYRVISNEKKEKKENDDSKVVVTHKIRSGESLSTIAKKYNTTVAEIVNENQMSSTVVMAGKSIKVPTKKSKNFKIKTVSTKAKSEYSWKSPTKGWLSSPYGWRIHPVRKKRSFHAGIDLAAPKGTAIYSVAPGRVIYTGTRSGYGKLVIVSHEGGLSTRYAHCSQILVKNGQYVKEGQLLAKVGATGVATGNHLHFEVRKNGKTQNPYNYLRK